MATNSLLVKRKLNNMVLDLLSDVDKLKINSKGETTNGFNTIMALIDEKENTIEQLQTILKIFE